MTWYVASEETEAIKVLTDAGCEAPLYLGTSAEYAVAPAANGGATVCWSDAPGPRWTISATVYARLCMAVPNAFYRIVQAADLAVCG